MSSKQHESNIKMVPFNSIKIDPDLNARRQLKEIPELAASIEENGLLAPLGVTNGGDDKQPYTLAYGNRRAAALQLLKWGSKPVPVMVLDDVNDSAIANLVENIERSDLHPLDLAEQLSNMVKGEYAVPANGEAKVWDKKALAERVGMSVITLNNHIRVNESICAEAGRALRGAKVPRPQQKHLFTWAMIKDEEKQLAAVEEWIKAQELEGPKARNGKKKGKSGDTEKADLGFVKGKKKVEQLKETIKVLEFLAESAKGVDKADCEGKIAALKWMLGKTKNLPGITQADWDAVFPPEAEDEEEESSEE